MQDEPNVLIVDDEEDIRDLLQDYLSGLGCTTATAEDAGSAKSAAAGASFDAALIDVTMPGEDGFSLARHLRANGDLGIIMVTASGEVYDRVVGLELGADDYIVKPFSPKEVALRLNSVLRRAAKPLVPAFRQRAITYVGAWEFESEEGRLISDSGEATALSPSECALLKAFLSHADEPLSRRRLKELTGEPEASDRSIDVRVARLRQRVEPVPAKPQIIKTIRGQGYMFVSA